jgi:glucose/arabinose dehydrogenase
MRQSLVLVGWCVLTSFPSSTWAFPRTQNAFPNLPLFSLPVDLQNPGDGSNRLFVVEKEGRIWVFDNSPATSTRTLFLDISARVRTDGSSGLLALAFHPDYENNGVFFVMYNTGTPMLSRWSRFHVSADPDVADPLSEVVLLEFYQVTTGHKGCGLVFGGDGYLYTSVGDDVQGWPGQELTTLMGKLLRIDVDHPPVGFEYGIPSDNPLVGNPNNWREEIFAWGFRNPWRFNIDPETNQIFLGDVGEAKWEEVNIVTKGRNYGWNKIEGNQCFPNPAVCDTVGRNAVAPVFQYPHASEIGNAVIGGYVYRGTRFPELWGKYIYADVSDGLFELTFDGTSWTSQLIEFNDPSRQYSTFGIDEERELYVVSIFGEIYRFADTVSEVDPSMPPPFALNAEPNPFRNSTTFRFPSDVDVTGVIDVYDVQGRRVRSLAAATRTTSVEWDGRDAHGHEVASGVYFARLSVDGRTVASRQVVIVR